MRWSRSTVFATIALGNRRAMAHVTRGSALRVCAECRPVATWISAWASHLLSIEPGGREITMTRFLLRGMVVIGTLMLAACASDDAQTTERGIDQDIIATHDAGGPTARNIGQRDFAPWRLDMSQ